MFIIWGSRGIQRRVASGSFYCPHCRNDSSYDHIRLSRWFTLYFIPLFPTSTLGEAVHCNNCGGDFKLSVLSLSRELIESALQPWSCSNCGNSNPADQIVCLRCSAVRRTGLPNNQKALPDRTTEFYLHRNGAQEGPLSMADILAGRQRGIYADVDLIWNDATQKWDPLGQFLAGR